MGGEANSTVDLLYVKRIKAKYEAKLMQHPHVVGVGIGLAPAKPASDERGEGEGEERSLALVINVDDEVGRSELPTELEGVPVTVRNTGSFKAL